MRIIKRFVAFLFVPLFISDICSYIKFFIESDSPKIEEFVFCVTKTSECNIYNLCLIYFIIVSGLYFLFNFFKPNYEIK